MNETSNERRESKPNRKKADAAGEKNQPVKVIRHGAIAASIWQRQAQSGYEYFDFTLSRAWKSQTGDKAGYSQSFFEANRDALVKCVEEAVAFIEANKATDQPDQLAAA